ncbi:hypothetical protein C1H46_002391 [Malus baccata]|uniref:Uncharacterized protein n=1 Tax=Malus baccata TaxID=106549 RepID=A0A540NLU1_MALBA|nr:hypothetical protein C1H46_002391 [Malus baccata]
MVSAIVAAILRWVASAFDAIDFDPLAGHRAVFSGICRLLRDVVRLYRYGCTTIVSLIPNTISLLCQSFSAGSLSAGFLPVKRIWINTAAGFEVPTERAKSMANCRCRGGGWSCRGCYSQANCRCRGGGWSNPCSSSHHHGTCNLPATWHILQFRRNIKTGYSVDPELRGLRTILLEYLVAREAKINRVGAGKAN